MHAGIFEYKASKYSDRDTMDMGSSIVSIYHAGQAHAVGVIPKVCQESIVSMVFSSST
jgi:hypothetical protein